MTQSSWTVEPPPSASVTGTLSAAGVLLTDEHDRILMVSNPYREGLVLPGGGIEFDESPAQAAEREVEEELGLVVCVTRLLAVHHRTDPVQPAVTLYVFDADPIPSGTPLVLQPGEITETFWLTPAEAIRQHAFRGQLRLEAALQARATNQTIYLDDNHTLPGD
ncbi:NUDIX hydrolase [Kribbella sp. NBC_01245]|uniref:NUDIX hydrolase n=1 Tax=Kribbella sp. NBC_01245 TaxID=2903578 RepID=UPI002E2C6A92|nr:NUDIX hydrolase [Kribbella sp. NBC_01245]